jgi:hypothetical protein
MNMEDAQSGKVNIGDVPGTFIVEQEKEALAFFLVSIDDDISAPIDKLLDLPAAEYEAVVKEVNAIQNPTSRESSAQSGSGTFEPAA